MAYLTRKPGGRYHVRVRIPLDLVARLGRHEIRRSLHTSNPKTARLLAGRVAAAIMDALETMRMSDDKDRLDRELAEATRIYADGMEACARAQSTLHDARDMMDAIKDGQVRIREERLIGVASALAQGIGAVAPAGPDPFKGLHANARRPWHSLIDAYFQGNPHLSVSTVKNYKTAFAYLARTIGTEKPVALVDKVDITSFREYILANAKTRGGRSIVSAGSQAKNLTAVKSFFTWAESLTYRSDNPVAGVRATKAAQAEAEFFERRPFEPTELDALFQLPLFTGAASPSRPNIRGAYLIDDHRYFAPLAALWTGARKSELLKAKLEEIEEHDGAVYIAVATRPEKGEDSPATVKAFRRAGGKTVNAKRIIPLHPTLMDALGFRDYLARRRKECPNGGPIFPAFGFGQMFNQRLAPAIGLGADPTVSLHSLRHTMKDMLRNARFDEAFQNRILGHAPATAGANYGKALTSGEIKQFNEAVEAPCNLSHLYPSNRRS